MRRYRRRRVITPRMRIRHKKNPVPFIIAGAAALIAVTVAGCAHFSDPEDTFQADGTMPTMPEKPAVTEMTDATETEPVQTEASAERITEAVTTEGSDVTEVTEDDIPQETTSSYDDDNYDNDDYDGDDEDDYAYRTHVERIELSTYEVELRVGEKEMPLVTMYPDDADDMSEIWISSDKSVAIVDNKGNILGKAAGECEVTVKSVSDPLVTATVRVTVKADPNEAAEPTYINGILVVNKTYGLPSSYNPGVDEKALKAFNRMAEDAADEGLDLYISSSFRSYEYQGELYQRYVDRSGKEEADRYSARPGYSEHQTGLAFDLNTIDISFDDTDEYRWLKRHCAEYGFVIRYPKEKEDITGYIYEPWHIRYLGVDLATELTESGLTLEEYLGIDSRYKGE